MRTCSLQAKHAPWMSNTALNIISKFRLETASTWISNSLCTCFQTQESKLDTLAAVAHKHKYDDKVCCMYVCMYVCVNFVIWKQILRPSGSFARNMSSLLGTLKTSRCARNKWTKQREHVHLTCYSFRLRLGQENDKWITGGKTLVAKNPK